ncbi:MAG: hypothetical protein ACXW2H_08355 [Candidatus Aminicenantales bacterium]
MTGAPGTTMDDSGQSGYYQEIARAFLERRGGALVLSPKDQAAIAVWEEKRIPLSVVLEGIGRTFEGLKARGRATRSSSLAFCDREVEAAFSQHRDRIAGRRKTAEAAPRADKKGKAGREIAKAAEALSAADPEMARLLHAALEALSSARPEAAALERIETEIEDALWTGATAAERAEARAEALKTARGQRPAGLDDEVRRRVVMTARLRRRVPHVSLHYY